MKKIKEGRFDTIKRCPCCQSDKLSPLIEVPGSLGYADDFACLNCLRYFQVNYGDAQGGGFDVIYQREV